MANNFLIVVNVKMLPMCGVRSSSVTQPLTCISQLSIYGGQFIYLFCMEGVVMSLHYKILDSVWSYGAWLYLLKIKIHDAMIVIVKCYKNKLF